MKGEAFVKMPRDLLQSRAWQSLGINARRFLDFLMLEHMSHGGRRNGRLLAPRRQLEHAGIGARYASAAIEETVRTGLVLAKRGSGRQASLYALSWLPLEDGTMTARPWATASIATSPGKSLAQTSLGIPQMLPKGSREARSDFPRGGAKRRSDFPSTTAQREAPYKNHDLTRQGLQY